MKHLSIALAVLGGLAATACRSTDEPEATYQVAESRTVSINVTGMTWGVGCPPRVQGALASVEGVENVDVDYASKTATVTCTSDCSEEDMVEALKAAGYEGTVEH